MYSPDPSPTNPHLYPATLLFTISSFVILVVYVTQ